MLQLILATSFIASMYELNRPFYPHDSYPSPLDMIFVYEAIKQIDKIKLHDKRLNTKDFHNIQWKIKVTNESKVDNDGEYIIISKKMLMPSFLTQTLLRQKLIIYMKKVQLNDITIINEECNNQQI